ncbi:hypothetical protein [Streptomyces sp. NBC_01207]|uniref:hypothetical protein n=1 Tax=Streptomyces sp. NBC_01207 TaxID=2903772 RepID=UPI002E0F268C|nr:hypothetical protein OG457_30685 [Streptomyces sp. NBC_01207]
MGDPQWVKNIEKHLEESEFLNEHETGAKVGRIAGGVVYVAGLGAGVIYLGTTGIAANAAQWAAGQEAAVAVAASAGTITAAEHAGFRAGKKVGEKAVKPLLKRALAGGWVLCRAGGAYAGAGCEARLDWLAWQLA